ncbi:MAG: hypothetical protein NVS1B11_05940 [Terriglobales bacterium]
MEAFNMADLTALTGQVAVITGGGRGIGSAIARKLASLGSSVILCGRSTHNLESTSAAIRARGRKGCN